MLITGEAGELVRVSIADGTEQILTKTGRVERFVVSPDGAKIAVGFTDGGVQLLRIGEERPLQVFKGHTQAVTSMTFNREGSLLLTAARDGAARLWRLDERESAQHFEAVESDIEMVGFDEDEGRVLILSDDQIARWPISAVVLANADEQVRMACVRLAALGIDGFAPQDLDRHPILKKAPKDPCLAAGVAKPVANAALPAPASGPAP
jgi:WD40 repeat protein